jgi:hypothetical protein
MPPGTLLAGMHKIAKYEWFGYQTPEEINTEQRIAR